MLFVIFYRVIVKDWCKSWVLAPRTKHVHCIKYARIRVFTGPYSPVQGDSVLIRRNTGQWKPIFSHILCSGRLIKSVTLKQPFRGMLNSSCCESIHIQQHFCIILHMNFKNQLPEVFYKKAVPKNFATFTGKHLCWNLFFNEVTDLRPEHLFWKTSANGCFLT